MSSTQYTAKEMKMSKRVKIVIEFERDDIDNVDVEEYLVELIENGGLHWEIEDE